jgi:hypothetical protein
MKVTPHENIRKIMLRGRSGHKQEYGTSVWLMNLYSGSLAEYYVGN